MLKIKNNLAILLTFLLISLTSTIQSLFQNELLKDEKILWAGQPETSVILRSGDIYLIVFGLFWTGFTIFWESVAIKSGVLVLTLWGIPFVLVGLYLLFGRFIYRNYMKKRTFYAVTNQRVIILVRSFNLKIQSKLINQIPVLDKTISKNGIGTIQFDNTGYMMMGRGSTRIDVPTFYDIKDADTVYKLISDLRTPRIVV